MEGQGTKQEQALETRVVLREGTIQIWIINITIIIVIIIIIITIIIIIIINNEKRSWFVGMDLPGDHDLLQALMIQLVQDFPDEQTHKKR